MMSPVRVVVDAANYLLFLIGCEVEVIQTLHQAVEAPRTIQDAGVLDNVEPCLGIDVDQKLDQPLQVRVKTFGAAVEAQDLVAQRDPASIVELAGKCNSQALAFLTGEVLTAIDDSPDNFVEVALVFGHLCYHRLAELGHIL